MTRKALSRKASAAPKDAPATQDDDAAERLRIRRSLEDIEAQIAEEKQRRMPPAERQAEQRAAKNRIIESKRGELSALQFGRLRSATLDQICAERRGLPLARAEALLDDMVEDGTITPRGTEGGARFRADVLAEMKKRDPASFEPEGDAPPPPSPGGQRIQSGTDYRQRGADLAAARMNMARGIIGKSRAPGDVTGDEAADDDGGEGDADGGEDLSADELRKRLTASRAALRKLRAQDLPTEDARAERELADLDDDIADLDAQIAQYKGDEQMRRVIALVQKHAEGVPPGRLRALLKSAAKKKAIDLSSEAPDVPTILAALRSLDPQSFGNTAAPDVDYRRRGEMAGGRIKIDIPAVTAFERGALAAGRKR